MTPQDPEKKALVDKYVELGAMIGSEVMKAVDPWDGVAKRAGNLLPCMTVPYFCGNSAPCRKRDRFALETAKFNLEHHFAAVGLLEELDDSMKLYEMVVPEFFNGMQYQYRRLKDKLATRTKTQGKKQESDMVKSYLRERLKPEIEFYNFARELMYLRLNG